MTSQTLMGSLLVLMTGFGIPAVGAQSAHDEAEIRDLQARQQEAWNRHDAKAYAALFTDDGDVVNVVGWWWKGRSEIETNLTAAFAVVFRDSTLKINDLQVRFLARDVAVAHVRWSMEGSKTPPGFRNPERGFRFRCCRNAIACGGLRRSKTRTAFPRRRFQRKPRPIHVRDSRERKDSVRLLACRTSDRDSTCP